MKTLIKLILTVLVLNAAWHIGSAYWDHYQFEDAVQEAVQFQPRVSPDEITAKVVDLAGRQDLPLQAEDVNVTKEQRKVTVDASYSRDIEIFPRYSRQWAFSMHIIVYSLY